MVRTQNICFMSVTLDVSKLSGWLNTSALCRVARWACDAGSRCAGQEMRGRCAGAAHTACRQGLGCMESGRGCAH